MDALISGQEFDLLKENAFRYVKILSENGGPAASRFHQKLSKVIEGIKSSKKAQGLFHEKIDRKSVNLTETKSKFADIQVNNDQSNGIIDCIRDDIERVDGLCLQLDDRIQKRDEEIQQKKNAIDRFKNIIDAGPGWREHQETERDGILKLIDDKSSSLKCTRSDLQNLKEKITMTMNQIKQKEREYDETTKELNNFEVSIESSNEQIIEQQTEMVKYVDHLEATKLEITHAQEELTGFRLNYKKEKVKQQMAGGKVDETKVQIEDCKRKIKEIERSYAKLSSNLLKQKEKNETMDTQNISRVNQINEIKTQSNTLSAEIKPLIVKKQIMSHKIIALETARLMLEKERDELKVENDKIVSVDMNIQKRESEIYRRQKESLQREMDIVDRKKNRCEKSSSVIMDLTHSYEVTFKILQHDLENLKIDGREKQKKNKLLKERYQQEHTETTVTATKVKDAMAQLQDEGDSIEHLQFDLDQTDKILNQKQQKCEELKSECNTRSKVLVANHEEIERVKRGFNVIDRQLIQIKTQINRIEDDLVTEHFNHHQIIEDKMQLQADLDATRKKIQSVSRIIKQHEEEIFDLHQSISLVDRDCNKFVKEYGHIVGYRDSIDNILLKKTEDLTRIKEKIKIQQAMLHKSENTYQEQMLTIAALMEKLKELSKTKNKREEESQLLDEYVMKRRRLESEIQNEKSKVITLKDELGRPFNIHRWRILEFQNPTKFDKVKTIQKMQKSLIENADEIAGKEREMRDVESSYLHSKRIINRQPQIAELRQEVIMFKATFGDKQTHMQKIEVEMNLTKRNVEKLRGKLKSLDSEREEMKSMWIDSVSDK